MSMESTLIVYTTPRASGSDIIEKRKEIDRAMDSIRAQQAKLIHERCRIREQKKLVLFSCKAK